MNPATPFILGACQITVTAGTPAVTSQTGLLLDSSVGVGHGVVDSGVGAYTLNLSPECDVASGDCYVLGCVATGTTFGSPTVDLTGLAGAVADPATQASVEVLFKNAAGAAVDVDGFTITLAKRPRI